MHSFNYNTSFLRFNGIRQIKCHCIFHRPSIRALLQSSKVIISKWMRKSIDRALNVIILKWRNCDARFFEVETADGCKLLDEFNIFLSVFSIGNWSLSKYNSPPQRFQKSEIIWCVSYFSLSFSENPVLLSKYCDRIIERHASS